MCDSVRQKLGHTNILECYNLLNCSFNLTKQVNFENILTFTNCILGAIFVLRKDIGVGGWSRK